MRTIKFKAKTLKDSEWIVGDLAHINGDTLIRKEDDSELVFAICHKVIPDTVCQFTGFTDKHGKEVYEGDVLRSDIYPFSYIEDDNYDNYYGVIGWSEEEALFYIVAINNPKSSVRGIYDDLCYYILRKKMKQFEVIGNIHDLEWKQYSEYLQDKEDKEQQP